MNFTIKIKSKTSKARTGTIKTPHGVIHTPYFIPVATSATVRALNQEDMKGLDAEVLLANTYHLHLRPGDKTIKKLGGLHKFMNWQKPLFTDSGGFQAFSLGYGMEHNINKLGTIFPKGRESAEKQPKIAEINDNGVAFKDPLSGKLVHLSPKKSIEIQKNLGADIILAFDECTSPLSGYEYTKKAMDRTHKWAKESLYSHKKPLKQWYSTSSLMGGWNPLCSKTNGHEWNTSVKNHSHSFGTKNMPPVSDRWFLTTEKNKDIGKQSLYGIVQGGEYRDLRLKSAKFISSLNFDGIAIGGSLGKSKSDMHRILEWVVPLLPESRPRHLLGIGEIDDLFECVERGIDTFDCVMPTRIGRRGALLISPVSGGNIKNKFRINIKKSKYRLDRKPIDKACSCLTCKNYSRAYLNHLYKSQELAYYRLASLHNINFMLRLMEKIRDSINNNSFDKLKKNWVR